MRAWLPVVLLVGACGSAQGTAPPPPDRAAAPPEPEARAEEPAEDAPADALEPLGECHVSCCSDAVLALQAASDDPSIANECCFCE